MAEEIVTNPVKKKLGLGDSLYRHAKTVEDEEKELEDLVKVETKKQKLQEQKAAQEAEELAEPTDPEEKSFKKRYGDLRRHSQKQKAEFDKRLSTLEQQLSAATKKQIKLPKTEAELANWAKQYPDVAAIVETIAIKKAGEQSKTIEARVDELNKLQRSAERATAEAKLIHLHPDFEDIRSTDEFHTWAEIQPKWVQAALYDNDSDAEAAGRAIDLYKLDNKIKTKTAKSKSNKDAARSVSTYGTKVERDIEDNTGTWRESTVEQMSTVEYEKNQESIMDAIRSGTFVYDISGAARL
jgi:hypothetical protein